MSKLRFIIPAALAALTLTAGAASAHPHRGNQVRIVQTGDDNRAVAAQSGENNRLRIRQRGDNLNADISQSGDSRLFLKQFGEDEYLDLDMYEGEHRTIIQGSNGNGRAVRRGMNRY